jgi:hypothetical protein
MRKHLKSTVVSCRSVASPASQSYRPENHVRVAGQCWTTAALFRHTWSTRPSTPCWSSRGRPPSGGSSSQLPYVRPLRWETTKWSIASVAANSSQTPVVVTKWTVNHAERRDEVRPHQNRCEATTNVWLMLWRCCDDDDDWLILIFFLFFTVDPSSPYIFGDNLT